MIWACQWGALFQVQLQSVPLKLIEILSVNGQWRIENLADKHTGDGTLLATEEAFLTFLASRTAPTQQPISPESGGGGDLSAFPVPTELDTTDLNFVKAARILAAYHDGNPTGGTGPLYHPTHSGALCLRLLWKVSLTSDGKPTSVYGLRFITFPLDSAADAPSESSQVNGVLSMAIEHSQCHLFCKKRINLNEIQLDQVKVVIYFSINQSINQLNECSVQDESGSKDTTSLEGVRRSVALVPPQSLPDVAELMSRSSSDPFSVAFLNVAAARSETGESSRTAPSNFDVVDWKVDPIDREAVMMLSGSAGRASVTVPLTVQLSCAGSFVATSPTADGRDASVEVTVELRTAVKCFPVGGRKQTVVLRAGEVRALRLNYCFTAAGTYNLAEFVYVKALCAAIPELKVAKLQKPTANQMLLRIA